MYELTALLEGVDMLGVTFVEGICFCLFLIGDTKGGAIDDCFVRWPWLVLGLGRLSDEAGRDTFRSGLSDGKKLDFLRRGDGEGGSCDKVSIVRSDKEGLGRRRGSACVSNCPCCFPDDCFTVSACT